MVERSPRSRWRNSRAPVDLGMAVVMAEMAVVALDSVRAAM
jgi:hypothetical protein